MTSHLLQNAQSPSSLVTPVLELTSGTAATDELRTHGNGIAEKCKENIASI